MTDNKKPNILIATGKKMVNKVKSFLLEGSGGDYNEEPPYQQRSTLR
jgi:hypothetical protein